MASTKMKMFSFYADPKDIETWRKAAAAESRELATELPHLRVRVTLADWCRHHLNDAAAVRKVRDERRRKK